MREIFSVPIAILCYVVSVVVILIFCNWFFDNPKEWSYAIPIITASGSLALACDIAKEKLKSKTGAKITALIISLLWILFVIVDISGSINDIINVLAGKNIEPDAMDVIIFYVDILLNSKIFAIVSCLFTAGELNSK